MRITIPPWFVHLVKSVWIVFGFVGDATDPPTQCIEIWSGLLLSGYQSADAGMFNVTSDMDGFHLQR
jgi:hypothetical protein